MRVLIAGQKAFGAAVFDLCKALNIEVVAVAAPPWSEGREGEIRDRLRAKAEDGGAAWIPSGKLKADTCPGGVDLIIAAHSHSFISEKLRARARLGAIGYHPSLLPLHRGRDAVRWAIHMGERVTGGTVYWLTNTIDAGPVASQRHVFIRPGDTPDVLWRRELFPLGVELFGGVLKDLLSGRMVRVPQDHALATWEPSWDRAPVHRPDLDALGPGGWDGYDVDVSATSVAFIRELGI